MKNLMIFLVLFFLFFSCAVPETIKEKVIIIREVYNLPDTAKVVQVWPEVEPIVIKNTKDVFEKIFSLQQLYAAHSSQTPEEDFNDGIMYVDNAESTNGVVHILDLSSLIQNKPSIVYFIIEWVAGCEDETFIAYFRPSGYNVQYASGISRYNQPSSMVSTITNDTGQIEWYHDYMWPYWQNPGCAPGFEIYKYQQIKIWAVFYANGVVVPKK